MMNSNNVEEAITGIPMEVAEVHLHITAKFDGDNVATTDAMAGYEGEAKDPVQQQLHGQANPYPT
jgi:hypothetical protein